MSNPDPTSREISLDPTRSALLFIDVQNFCARRDGGEFTMLAENERESTYGYYFDRLENIAIRKCIIADRIAV